MNMVSVTLEYDNDNIVLNGILKAIKKMPDVKIKKTVEAKTTTKKISTKEFSSLPLTEQANILSQSMNHDVPPMTMEKIAQEVRDYRNGK